MKINILDFCVNLNNQNKYLQGVYKIYFKNSPEKVYIGSAASTKKYGGFHNRFRCHIYDLIHKRHANNILQKACNKYKLENLRIEILEICSPLKCIEREQYYMDNLNSYYNICKIAGSTLGVAPSRSEIIRRSKPVLQYDLDGNFINEYFSVKEASNSTGINSGSIRNNCLRKNNQGRAGNFQWVYKSNEIIENNIPKYKYYQAKRLLCYDSKGMFFKEFPSILEASIELSIPTGNISVHINDKTRICYGYVFKEYYDDYSLFIKIPNRVHKNQFKVEVYNIDTKNIQSFDSFRQVPKEIISRNTLSAKIKNRIFEFTHKEKYKIKINRHNDTL